MDDLEALKTAMRRRSRNVAFNASEQAEARAILAALERAKQVEAAQDDSASKLDQAARTVLYEMDRQLRIPEVPQLGQVEWWANHLRAALAPVPGPTDA